MDVNRPQLFFKYLPVLSFTESFIYQVTIWEKYYVHLSFLLKRRTFIKF
jgi:hypothetical protein